MVFYRPYTEIPLTKGGRGMFIPMRLPHFLGNLTSP